MKRRASSILFSLIFVGACSPDPAPAPEDNPLCVFDCPERGVADGNAAISGVPSADTLFQAAVAYQSAADHASAALENELSQLRVDFGIGSTDALGAAIRTQGADALGQSPIVVALQARCWIDGAVYTAVRSDCDPEAPVSETIPCRGTCRVDLGTDCSGSADVQCIKNITSAECVGRCSGTCAGGPDADGGCDGVCLGTCAGTCDQFAKGTAAAVECAGRCSGRCTGTCVRPIVNGTCRGTCDGACRYERPTDGCDEAIEERCQPKSNRPFDCPGACGGTVEDVPTGNAECRAAALAQASYLARCDAPRVSIARAPASAAPSQRAERYLFALSRFEERLPELLASIAHAKLVRLAGQALSGNSSSEVKESLKAARSTDIATNAGLTCAIAEAPLVGAALEPFQRRLDAALAGADELLDALDIGPDLD